MHGLAHKAFHGFVLSSFGGPVWADVLQRVGEPVAEGMAAQNPNVLQAVIASTAAVLDRPVDAVLEDFGGHLVSHPSLGQLRRLLRYGGHDFVDFLISLEDLPDRCRLALPSLSLPGMQLDEPAKGRFQLVIDGGLPGIEQVMTGLVRAMADDYGVLALLDHGQDAEGRPTVTIELVDAGYQEARAFSLADRLL